MNARFVPKSEKCLKYTFPVAESFSVNVTIQYCLNLVIKQTLENKMAAADCAKSQDSSTDTVMPVEMQGLKEVLDKASKKPLIKEDTW